MNENKIHDNISCLNSLNFKIAELLTIKEKIEKEIIGLFNHDKEGSKTYNIEKYNVIIKTDFTYSLNKDLYEAIKYEIPISINPVKEFISYTINKKLLKDIEKSNDSHSLLTLSKIITKKPLKPNIKISANVRLR